MRPINENAIKAAQQIDAHDQEHHDTLMGELLDAARKASKRHANAADVYGNAAATVAACLPTLTFADDNERRRAIAYAAKVATNRAAADVAAEQDDALSLDALTDAEVIDHYDTPTVLNRPDTPRPDACTVVDRAEIVAGAFRRITDDETISALATLPMDYADRLAWTVRLSDLPNAGTYADALAAHHALTTDAETGKPLRRKGRPLSLRGALTVASGKERNSASKQQNAALDAALQEAEAAARAAMANSAVDPFHVTRPAPRRAWTDEADALASVAAITCARLPYAPSTDVPTWGVTTYTTDRPNPQIGGKAAAAAPAPGLVVSIDTNTGHASIGGQPIGHVGHPATWEAIAAAHATPGERAARTRTDAQPIGYAHDPACQHAPTFCLVAPVYAETRADMQERAAEYGHAPTQRGPVTQPARTRKNGTGATGPTQTAGKPADTDAAAEAARRAAYRVN